MEIVTAERKDVPIILQLIKELAEYEGLLSEVTATSKDLEESLFEQQQAKVLLVKEEDEIIGFALYFINFSTFIGRGSVYLEDLYIRPAYRGIGAGKALIKRLATIALDMKGERLQWWCLKDNEASLKFYSRLGAKQQSEWVVLRVDGKQLRELADK